MVLLGAGHQVLPAGTASGHGWAVTMASVIALVSTGTIVVILARALRAINPEAEAAVQREYQQAAVALAARDELLKRESLQVMVAGTGPYTFSPAYPVPGLTIIVKDPGQRVVHDVLVWRLRFWRCVASWRHHNPRVVRPWPGKSVSSGAALMTIDPSSGWLGRWGARHCVRVRNTPSDLLGNAVTASR